VQVSVYCNTRGRSGLDIIGVRGPVMDHPRMLRILVGNGPSSSIVHVDYFLILLVDFSR